MPLPAAVGFLGGFGVGLYILFTQDDNPGGIFTPVGCAAIGGLTGILLSLAWLAIFGDVPCFGPDCGDD